MIKDHRYERVTNSLALCFYAVCSATVTRRLDVFVAFCASRAGRGFCGFVALSFIIQHSLMFPSTFLSDLVSLAEHP